MLLVMQLLVRTRFITLSACSDMKQKFYNEGVKRVSNSLSIKQLVPS